MKRIAFSLLPLAAVFVLAASAQAQGPGGPGGFQPPPAMMAKFKAWQRWRDSHKNVSSLQQTLGGLEALEQDPRLALSRPQARTVLAVLKKWQVKPALTDAQALQVNKQITAPLTLVQLKKIVTMPHGRGPGGFGGGGGRGPGGGGRGFGGGGSGFGGGRGPGGGRPAFDPSRMPDPRDYNPLNPDTLPFARARTFAKQRHDQLLAALAASAK